MCRERILVLLVLSCTQEVWTTGYAGSQQLSWAWPRVPDVPKARDPPVHAHTKAWQEKVNGYNAFIFVTPQYNLGYPAALKNAIDYLYHEWKCKPAVVISYGTRGGGRAAEQLKQVLTGLRTQVIPTMPCLTLTEAHIFAGATDASIAEHFTPHVDDVQLVAKLLEGVTHR